MLCRIYMYVSTVAAAVVAAMVAVATPFRRGGMSAVTHYRAAFGGGLCGSMSVAVATPCLLVLFSLVLHPVSSSGCKPAGINSSLTGTAAGMKNFFLAKPRQSCSSACARHQMSCDLEAVAAVADDLLTCRRAIADIGHVVDSYGTYIGAQGGCTLGTWPSHQHSDGRLATHNNWAQVMSQIQCRRQDLVLDWRGGQHETGHALFGSAANSSQHFAHRNIVLTSPADACTALNTTGNHSLAGKVALIRRGGVDPSKSSRACYFVDKVRRVQAAGAVAAVIFNNRDSGIVNMAAYTRAANVRIPAFFIARKEGEVLQRAITRGTTTVTLRCALKNVTCSVMLASSARRRVCACDCLNSTNAFGLYFEAYNYTRGKLADWKINVHGDPWHNMAPVHSHPALSRDFVFSNAKSFMQEIPEYDLAGSSIMRWRGEFKAAEAGAYWFCTRSSDGSRLYINRRLVVNNDGVHRTQTRYGKIKLKEGWHNITILFFNTGRRCARCGANLFVYVRRPSWRVLLPLRSDWLRPFTLTTTESRGCEGSRVLLRCQSGVISVISASYGRQHGREICPHQNTRDQKCHADESLSIVMRLCNGRRACSVKATEETFGDPCAGTHK